MLASLPLLADQPHPLEHRRFAFITMVAVALSVAATACQRVPLLAPTGSSITLTSATTVLPTNGTADLVAQVLESAGTTPQDGTLVTFTTTLGTIQPPWAETAGGRAVVKFLAGNQSGTATITASSGGAGGTTTGGTGTTTGGTTAAATSASNTVKIAIGAAAVGSITVGASTYTVASLGGSSTITASVRDTNGNALPGVPVSFTTDNGTLSAGVVNTDPNGNAQTILTTNKTSKVTATVGIGSGTGSTATPGQSNSLTVNVNSVSSISVGPPVPATPSVGQSVTFTLTYGTDANSSPIQSVTVDFGDGTPPVRYTGKPPSVSHTYTAIGSYSITATALDALGDRSLASGSVNVSPLASVTVGAPSPAAPFVGQPVTFPLTYPTTSTPIQRVVVQWGDGSSDNYGGSPSSISHSYRSPGTYAVRVTAFDAFGNTSPEGGASIFITARPQPTVTISLSNASSTPTAGTNTAFSASVTPATGSGAVIQDTVIDYGDGSRRDLGPATGAFVLQHVYENGGTYTVVLSATDSNGERGQGTTQIFVQAAAPLAVSLNASQITSGANTTVTFTATPIGLGNAVVDNYHWIFGGSNGTADTASNTQIRSYTVGSGPITVSVTITTSDGRQATGSTVITP